MEENKVVNINLNADTVEVYLMSTKDYEEEQEDKRKKPVFLWKAFHMYPIVKIPDEDGYIDEDDENPLIGVMTEGGTAESHNYVPMYMDNLTQLVRDHPEIRVFPAGPIFSEINVF